MPAFPQIPSGVETPPPRIRAVAPGTVRAAHFAATPALLVDFGVDPAPVLAEFGLSANTFTEPNNIIAYSTGAKLLERCAEITGCDHFGLLVGERTGPTALGLTGYLILNSPTVEAALHQLEENLKLHGRGGAVQVASYGDQVSLIFTAHVETAHAKQLIHGALATMFNIMRRICGVAWLPTETRFALPEPDDSRAFRRFFRAPVRFNAAQSMLVFPKRWLASAVPGADATLFQLLDDVAESLRLRYRDDVIGDVRRTILELLSSGKVSIELVAEKLDIHPRTLNRRLKEHGTSFITLLTELRCELATQLLNDSDLSITRIGLSVGYTSASSFTRSFERMTGCSPKNWRAENGTLRGIAIKRQNG